MLLKQKPAFFGAALLAFLLTGGFAQQDEGEQKLILVRQNRLNGPRLGITYVFENENLDRDGTLAPRLSARGIDNIISQFGWHFEWVVAPESGGPAFATQFMPFVRGVEYGIVIPSASLMLGIRMPVGIEFGMGPDVMATFDEKEPVVTSLMIGFGHTVRFGGVRIPIKVALSTSKAGNHISFVFGYAFPRVQIKSPDVHAVVDSTQSVPTVWDEAHSTAPQTRVLREDRARTELRPPVTVDGPEVVKEE